MQIKIDLIEHQFAVGAMAIAFADVGDLKMHWHGS
jgi:hypothetical protein